MKSDLEDYLFDIYVLLIIGAILFKPIVYLTLIYSIGIVCFIIKVINKRRQEELDRIVDNENERTNSRKD